MAAVEGLGGVVGRVARYFIIYTFYTLTYSTWNLASVTHCVIHFRIFLITVVSLPITSAKCLHVGLCENAKSFASGQICHWLIAFGWERGHKGEGHSRLPHLQPPPPSPQHLHLTASRRGKMFILPCTPTHAKLGFTSGAEMVWILTILFSRHCHSTILF